MKEIISFDELRRRQIAAWERDYAAAGIKSLIAELTARLSALESAQSSDPGTNDVAIHESDTPKPGKRRPGRPRGSKGNRNPWSAARHAAHKAKQERRRIEIANNPVAQALMGQLSSLAGNRSRMAQDVSQASS